jgi:predicted RNA-binding protein YlxR (DUF448 family)
MRPKRELVRVVRTPSGEIQVDVTGKVSGRGAYVCPTAECIEAGTSGRRLEHALGVPVPEHSITALREVADRVPPAPRREGPRLQLPGRT